MKKSTAILTVAAAGGAAILLKGLDNRLEVTHYTISSSRIPKGFDGFKISHISDIHADWIPGLISEIAGERPDIIVSTGDLIHHRGGYTSSLHLCQRLMQIAPVYAVTGNHDVWRGDYDDFEAELSSVGVITLHNERIELKRNGERIAISGIDDPFSSAPDVIKKKLTEASDTLSGYTGYNILLFHRANWLDFFKNYDFDLILSGHMHGGQVRIPGVGGLVEPSSGWANSKNMFFPKYIGGLYRYNKTTAIVSRGLGNPMLVPRVFNRPELIEITLKHKGE